ncbi:MAG: hypothetical protein M3O15_12635 [Acidobacteriota bacterium]|nr:hypothetical protein [Acidobacteriota bacterium]
MWDLVNSSASYPAAIPVLLKHLKIARHPVLRAGIARALTVREARDVAGRGILDELKQRVDESPNEARWALANALIVAADASMAEEIEALSKGARCVDLRERLQLALKKLGLDNDRQTGQRAGELSYLATATGEMSPCRQVPHSNRWYLRGPRPTQVNKQ